MLRLYKTSKSLSKMLRIVQNERFTIEFDSENALLNSTWNAEDSPSSAFQFSTVQWLASTSPNLKIYY